jgi:uncharacterized lipoprotein YmbA
MSVLATPRLVPGLAILCATACIKLGPKADTSRFLLLTPIPSAGHSTDSTAGNLSRPDQVTLGVGPIRLPGYLDRDELVTRISENRLSLGGNDRWGEPLEENFSRVLSQNLYLRLPGERVIRFPWPSTERPTYQVEIDVLRFEADTARRAQLVARWFLRDVATNEALSIKESHLSREAKGSSLDESVAMLSALLADLSSEIADALRTTRLLQ